jgi:hypothetical protein
MECPCCFEELTSSFASLACSHRFHITCLVNWFATQSAQELPQNCPCCRTEAGPTERLPEEEGGEDEGGEDEDDETDGTYEEDELMLTRPELHTILLSQGGTGVPDGLWFAFFDPEGDEELRASAEHRLPFVGSELSRMAVYQGGREISEERWEELVETYGESVELTQQQLEDQVWANGGVGVSPEQWAELVGVALSASFTRAELDAYLLSEDVRRDASHALTDDEWAHLLQLYATPHEEDEEDEEVPAALRITWRRCPDGHWERMILNPEEQEPASWGVDSAEPPPADLVEQTSDAARRFQALWRGFQERKEAKEEKKRQEMREAAAKIRAIWLGHKQREQYTAFKALVALRFLRC